MPLPAIITARLEKYRAETEAWLADYGIRYKELVMGPWLTKAERERSDVAAWKAKEFDRTGLELFVESDPAQAKAIHRQTGKNVLCPALGKVLEKADDQAPRQSGPANSVHAAQLASSGFVQRRYMEATPEC